MFEVVEHEIDSAKIGIVLSVSNVREIFGIFSDVLSFFHMFGRARIYSVAFGYIRRQWLIAKDI